MDESTVFEPMSVSHIRQVCAEGLTPRRLAAANDKGRLRALAREFNLTVDEVEQMMDRWGIPRIL